MQEQPVVTASNKQNAGTFSLLGPPGLFVVGRVLGCKHICSFFHFFVSSVALIPIVSEISHICESLLSLLFFMLINSKLQ